MKHLLTLSTVACDNLHLRANAHHWHVSAFLCNREFQGISYYIKIPVSQAAFRWKITCYFHLPPG